VRDVRPPALVRSNDLASRPIHRGEPQRPGPPRPATGPGAVAERMQRTRAPAPRVEHPAQASLFGGPFVAPPDAALPELERELQRLFGFSEFRPGQREAIEAVLSGRDCLAVMPTGSGKSITYLLPAFLLPGVTIVVSPLIALMQDQLSKLQARGLPATAITSHVPWDEQRRRLDALRAGQIKLLLVAPERFKNERFCEVLRGVRVALLAVDEAHCVSQWGHDFRPDYLRLGAAARELGRPPVLAVTATATRQVRDDIARQLDLGPELVTLVRGFDRPNLHLTVEEVEGGKGEKLRLLEELIRTGPQGPGIVYCATRKNTEKLAHDLTRAGVKGVGVYHAGLNPAQRQKVQEQFFDGRVKVVMATNAFGLGIDKADVRFVHHHDLPMSLEAYYQEAGRAGRDGQPARCALFFGYQDVHLQRFFIETSHPSRTIIESVARLAEKLGDDPEAIASRIAEKPNARAVESALRLLERSGGVGRVDFAAVAGRAAHEEGLLQKMLGYVRTPGCRRRTILRHFGADEPVGSCGACDRCVPSARKSAPTQPVRRAGGAGKPAAEKSGRTDARSEALGVALDATDPGATRLLARLRALRASLARKKRCPPYRVFHDKTLLALATHRPTTRAALLEVYGLGERKVDQFGDDLLAVLAVFGVDAKKKTETAAQPACAEGPADPAS